MGGGGEKRRRGRGGKKERARVELPSNFLLLLIDATITYYIAFFDKTDEKEGKGEKEGGGRHLYRTPTSTAVTLSFQSGLVKKGWKERGGRRGKKEEHVEGLQTFRQSCYDFECQSHYLVSRSEPQKGGEERKKGRKEKKGRQRDRANLLLYSSSHQPR